MVFLLSLVIFFIAVYLFWLAHQQQKHLGMPGGKLIYSDTRQWDSDVKPLYDSQSGLTGKPDYLVNQGKYIIPVEVKSGKSLQNPYDSHIFQLAAYCLLIERNLGKTPPYGILHYSNDNIKPETTRTYAIDYTQSLKTNLIDTIAEMHNLARKKDIHRSHESPARCQACGYKNLCDQYLS